MERGTICKKANEGLIKWQFDKPYIYMGKRVRNEH